MKDQNMSVGSWLASPQIFLRHIPTHLHGEIIMTVCALNCLLTYEFFSVSTAQQSVSASEFIMLTTSFDAFKSLRLPTHYFYLKLRTNIKINAR